MQPGLKSLDQLLQSLHQIVQQFHDLEVIFTQLSHEAIETAFHYSSKSELN